jgi:hypothetical protein
MKLQIDETITQNYTKGDIQVLQSGQQLNHFVNRYKCTSSQSPLEIVD